VQRQVAHGEPEGVLPRHRQARGRARLH
jgi:hypothetical protein